ncbi:MAG: phosphate regulon sensor histidine kinase PhoR [Proteobacteria bacterium]|nr:phosphate regulon sensor histidine kinase PhoR [Pseudomonadota bacterium]
MGFRLFGFMLFQAVGAVAGWRVHAMWGAVAGVILAGLAWLALDAWNAARVLRWMRQGGEGAVPAARSLWGEFAERSRRLLRQRAGETRAAEAQLDEFLAAIQASPNGVVLLDGQGRIEWCNQITAQHFGIEAPRDLQQQIGNLVRDPDFAAYCAGGDFSREVVIAGRASSPALPVRISVQLHPYGAGRRLLLSRDVTALARADAMRRDFVANVSHEIRTPLTVLAGFVETLRTLPLSDTERARYLDLMRQQAARMQTLVSDLLTLSRLEGGPLPGLSESTALEGLLARCLQDARALSALVARRETPGHDLRYAPPPGSGAAVQIAGSPDELQSAVANLLSNAVRYTPVGGVIELAWQLLPDGRLALSVQDSGPGIAAEHIPRLTERFYRVDRSRSRETGGTGLGLAIVKHVAERHGAELAIDSTPGCGARFTLLFPASRVSVAGAEPPQSAAQVAAAAPPAEAARQS